MIQLQPAVHVPAQSVTDLVFDTLYRAVVQLELPPGTRVSEAEIADRLQVSRQPVRDAFFRLANRGFLLIRPQRATLVTKISEAEVLGTAFIRIALETACMKEAITRVTSGEIGALRKLLSRQAAAAGRKDSRQFHELDEAFHECLCAIAGQPRVWSLIQEQKGHMDRARFLSLSFNQTAAYLEHVGIVDALEARDATSATERLEAHLSKIRAHLRQIRLAHGEYFEEKA
jgi:DNA-binding GntR family transcriptional regulator